MKDMGATGALAIVMGIAMRWGLNAEEAFRERIKPDFTDEKLAEIVRMPDGEGQGGVGRRERAARSLVRARCAAQDAAQLALLSEARCRCDAKPSAERSAEEMAAIARAMET